MMGLARTESPTQELSLARKWAGMFLAITSDSNPWSSPAFSAIQRLPASTVINRSAGVLDPSAFSRSKSSASLALKYRTLTPVFDVKTLNNGVISFSILEE